MKKNFPENFLESFILSSLFVAFASLSFLLLEKVVKISINEEFLLHISFIIGFCVTILALVRLFNRGPLKLSLNINFNKFGYYFIILISFIFLLSIPIIKLYESYMSSEPIITQNPLKSISYLVAAVTIAPIIEEIIYRGIILDGLLNNTKISKRKAVIFSSSLFAIIHINPIQVFSAFVLGFASGTYYSKTRNLLAAMILHCIANLFITLASYLHYKYGNSNMERVQDLYGEYSIVILIVSLILIIVFLIKQYKEKLNK